MKYQLGTVIAIVIIILTIQVGVGWSIYSSFSDWQTRGQFGDLFGAVNALFSGLAFAGLIYAILLQREDLSLQRTELELTRQELKRTATAQEQSEIALSAQAASTAQSAQLSAINFLLAHYKTELEDLRNNMASNDTPRIKRFQLVQQRSQALAGMLDSMFDEITETEPEPGSCI